MGSFLKSHLQTVQFLAQLDKRLLCWIGFLTCFLGGMEISFYRPILFVPAAILGSMHRMCAPIFFLKLAGLLKTDFLGNPHHGSSTGPLGSRLVLLRSFLTRWHMGFLVSTYVLISLERSLKSMHVHGSHAPFLQVVLILPLVRTHPENVTCQISLREWHICRRHASDVAWAVVPAG